MSRYLSCSSPLGTYTSSSARTPFSSPTSSEPPRHADLGTRCPEHGVLELRQEHADTLGDYERQPAPRRELVVEGRDEIRIRQQALEMGEPVAIGGQSGSLWRRQAFDIRFGIRARKDVLDSILEAEPGEVLKAPDRVGPADVHDVHRVTAATHRVGELVKSLRPTIRARAGRGRKGDLHRSQTIDQIPRGVAHRPAHGRRACRAAGCWRSPPCRSC